MSDNLYGQLFLQLVSKLSGRTLLEVIELALSYLEGKKPSDVGISRLIGDVDFQYMYPFRAWWWPKPPEGYIDSNAYLLLSRMPSSSPTQLVTMYEDSAKDLYSTYRSVLESAPKVDVSQPAKDSVAEYSKALTDSEQPSSANEGKAGFVKMATNAGAIPTANYVVADGKDWMSELEKKAEEKISKEDVFSPGGDSGLLGFMQNISFDFTNESLPLFSLSLKIPTPSDPFFAVFTSANEWVTFDIATYDQKVSVSVKVGAIARVPVQPDPHWYDSDYLQALAKRDSWNPPFTTTDVFGEKGLLSQRINGLIAACHYAFKVTVSPETFKKFQPIFETALGFRIGPFHFGLGISISQSGVDVAPNPAAWNHQARSNTSTFEGESMADYPTIIGALVERIVDQ